MEKHSHNPEEDLAKLKGKLIGEETEDQESRLKGNLVGRNREESPTESKLSIGEVITHRDSGDSYEVVAISEFRGRSLVNLINQKTEATITKDYDELLNSLKTTDSAWHR